MSDVVILRRESVVTLVQGQTSAPIITEVSAPTIVIQREGIPGTPGTNGTGGGGEALPHVHTQSTASVEWVVNHNYGFRPGSISLLTTGGSLMEAEVQHISLNQLRVYFVSEQVGSVIVSP